MSQASEESLKESTHLNQQTQSNQTSPSETIISASEIEKLYLESDIVILSACNTSAGNGSANAQGLSGLASAFFQAGTKSILVTHWDVETNSAVQLTTGTFDKMKNTKNLLKFIIIIRKLYNFSLDLI